MNDFQRGDFKSGLVEVGEDVGRMATETARTIGVGLIFVASVTTLGAIAALATVLIPINLSSKYILKKGKNRRERKERVRQYIADMQKPNSPETQSKPEPH